VPTFRGAGGLWRSHRAEDLATPQAFARDPRLVWEWYGMRRETVAGCAPNAAHHALARLAAASPGRVTIATQNVDGLHRVAAAALPDAAGRDAARPVELHGSLADARCTRCDHLGPLDGAVDATSLDTLPRCPACGALLRPAVVWFGESLDGPTLSGTWAAAHEADVCLVVGTSALVHPAASLPLVTVERGGRIVEVNPEETPLTPHAAASIRGAAAAVVPALVDGALAG
jgi:NAD-dependent deacetylase